MSPHPFITTNQIRCNHKHPVKEMEAIMALSSHSPLRRRNLPKLRFLFRFVSLIFLSRDIKLSLRSFHLKWSKASAHQSHDINQFVQAAAQRVIENLILKTSGFSFRLKLPLSIFNCRTLVVLRLEGFKVNDLSHVVVNFPFLKTLHLSYLIFKPVQYLLKLLFRCPILEELQIKHSPPPSLVLEKKFQCLPNLNRADISYFSSSATVLFTLICSVEVLRAELDTSYNHFPTFQNLTHMELIPKYKHCETWQWVIEVLKRCPKLQNLIIYEESENEEEVVDNWMDPSTIPECLSTQLKTCLLKDFKCTERGLQFAKYMMQNSKVLNTMTIKSASSIDTNAKYHVLMKLASWTRASSTCKLLFD